MRSYDRSILYIADILEWAKEFHQKHGRWPTYHDGRITGKTFTWLAVNSALGKGHRGLRSGSSLAKLFMRRCGRRHRNYLQAFTIDQILVWADAHYQRTNEWPIESSGKIAGAPGETWQAVHGALVIGRRGLPGGSTLPQLLAERRGVRNNQGLPRLTIKQILVWADAHHQLTKEWPTERSGKIAGAPLETWRAVQSALVAGGRGLPGGSTLAQLLAERRGVRNNLGLPRLTFKQIVDWADDFHAQTGAWPTLESAELGLPPGESWVNLDASLRVGLRGLPEGGSLRKLLARRRGVRNPKGLPRLSIGKILTWADAHYKRTGKWPRDIDGEIVDAPGETWLAVEKALQTGHRGLPGGSTLPRLLAARRGVRNLHELAPLTEKQILDWADAFHSQTGVWPTRRSGAVLLPPGETWANIDATLNRGGRGLPQASSLPRLLAEHRGVRNLAAPPKLSAPDILAWAEAHFARTGQWPRHNSGPIQESPGDTWSGVNAALELGLRGLSGGDSLARLLSRHVGKRNPRDLPKYEVAKIMEWAKAHYERTGRRPTVKGGPVAEAPGETWSAVNAALSLGGRGLPGGDTLARLLDWHGRRRDVRVSGKRAK